VATAFGIAALLMEVVVFVFAVSAVSNISYGTASYLILGGRCCIYLCDLRLLVIPSIAPTVLKMSHYNNFHGLAYYLYLVIGNRLEPMACVLYRLGVFR
jgi:hypothetical protein